MLAVMHYLRQVSSCILLSTFTFLVSCDDDDHKVTQIVEDNLESGNDWVFHQVGSAAHEGVLDNAISASSSHSLSITSSAAASDGFSYWVLTLVPQNIAVGSTLELKVKAKVAGVTGDGAYIAFRGDSTPSNSVFFQSTQGGSQWISGDKEFRTYTVTLESYPEGVSNIHIFLILDGNSTGRVNFDDISLTSHH